MIYIRVSNVLMLSRFSHVRLFATLWTIAHQVPLPVGFPQQENWNGWPSPPPEEILDPGIEESPALQVESLLLNHWGSPNYEPKNVYKCVLSSIWSQNLFQHLLAPRNTTLDYFSEQISIKIYYRYEFIYLVICPPCYKNIKVASKNTVCIKKEKNIKLKGKYE